MVRCAARILSLNFSLLLYLGLQIIWLSGTPYFSPGESGKHVAR